MGVSGYYDLWKDNTNTRRCAHKNYTLKESSEIEKILQS